MSGLGLLGAVGGLGGSFVNQAANIQRNEDRDAEYSRQQTFQDWLMQQREQYAIRAEDRAEAGEERKYQKERARLPEKIQDAVAVKKGVDYNPELLGMARDAKIADKNADLDWETSNIGKIAGITHAKAEAGVTSADRQRISIAAGHLGLEREKFTHTKDSDPTLKLPAAVKLQVANLQDQIKSINTTLTKAQVDGSYNEESAKPVLERQRVLQYQLGKLLEPYSQGGGGGKAAAGASTDVLGLRTTPASPAAAETGAVPRASAAKPSYPGIDAPPPLIPTRAAAAPSEPTVASADLERQRATYAEQIGQVANGLFGAGKNSLSDAGRAALQQQYTILKAQIDAIDAQLGSASPRGLIATANS